MHMKTATINRQALVQMREQEAGLRQAEMARLMRIDKSSLSNIESGKTNPAPATMKAIIAVLAEATGKSIDEVRAALVIQRDEAA